jgi:RHS repeat-associated protein
LTGFKAAPFIEPATGLAYFRNRWYDPATGTFLTPDPEGHADSSNLYAAFANDPVNNTDPLGTLSYDPARWGHAIEEHYNRARYSTYGRIIGLNPIVSMPFDLAAGSATTLLTIGERTGTALEEEGCHDAWSCTMTGSAIVYDAGNTFLFAVGFAGAAEAGITRLSNKLMPAEMFDIGLTQADAAQILDSLAPRITKAMVQRQTILRNVEASRAARPSPGFANYVEAEGRLSPLRHLREGKLFELQQLDELGLTPNAGEIWGPRTLQETESAVFKLIVGDVRYTAGGRFRGTKFDSIDGGLLEVKHGSSVLYDSYQLRLQTYLMLRENLPYTLRTTRPIDRGFEAWLGRWGVNVVKLTRRGRG